MANPRRTRPPHSGAWEMPILDREDPQINFGSWPIQVTNRISSTLKDVLIKPSVVRLLRSNLREWSNDDGWHCYRFLGAGSFGTAVAWQKKDSDGQLLDEIVVKEERQSLLSKYGKQDHPECFLEEAKTMHMLNRYGPSGNVIHMRGYKVFLRQPYVSQRNQGDGPIIHNEFHRLYLEYAPYGTLENLASRYRLFDRYLPELFLWHLFDSLARAAVALSLPSHPTKNQRCVHLDLKPANIFLGYEDARSRNPTTTGGLDGEAVSYPSIKLGDFGVTEKIQEPFDSLIEVIGVGTAYYKAPEMIRSVDDEREPPGQYGAKWDPPLYKNDDSLRPKADIWAIGKVMHDLCSLSQPSSFNTIQAKSRPEYVTNGDKMIPNFDKKPFEGDMLHARSPYTKALTDLIETCMHAEPFRRPEPEELYKSTTQILNERYQQTESKLPFSVRNRKLYYYGNEINDMSIEERNCVLPFSIWDWKDLLAPGNNHPDEPKLDIYPAQMWEMLPEDRQQGISTAFNLLFGRNEQINFREVIFENKERIRLEQTGIRFLDPDDGLNYNGKQDTAFFLRERERWGRRRGARKADAGNGNSHHDDDDDDDNGNDHNHGRPRGSRGSNGPRGKSAPSASIVRPVVPPIVKISKAPRRSSQIVQRSVLGGGVSSRKRVPKFTPYVPIDAHLERFENTADGEGLIFVVDNEPDLALIPEGLPNPSLTSIRKRAADLLDSADEEEDDSADQGRPRPRKRQRAREFPQLRER